MVERSLAARKIEHPMISAEEMARRRKWVRDAECTHAQEGMELDAAGKAVMEAFIAGEFEVTELMSRMEALDN